jgi:hypothetical protein
MSLSKESWGNNIWYLFHSLAHKLKEDKFESQKNNIIFIIKTICNTLPCPDCSKDATSMLNKIDFNTIRNKNDLKMFFFNFHNAINAKLNKPQFNYENLDSKYGNANIDVLYNNLYIIYSVNTRIPQLMSSNFHKNLSFPKIREALNALRNDLQ